MIFKFLKILLVLLCLKYIFNAWTFYELDNANLTRFTLSDYCLDEGSFAKLTNIFKFCDLIVRTFVYLSTAFLAVLFTSVFVYVFYLDLDLDYLNKIISLFSIVLIFFQLINLFKLIATATFYFIIYNSYLKLRFNYLTNLFEKLLNNSSNFLNSKLIIKLVNQHALISKEIEKINECIKFVLLLVLLYIPVIDVLLFFGYFSRNIHPYLINFSKILAFESLFLWISYTYVISDMNTKVTIKRYL